MPDVIGLGEVTPALAEARGYFARQDAHAIASAAIERGVALIEVAHDDDALRAIGDAVRTLRARDRTTVAVPLGIARALPSWASPIDRVAQALPAAYLRARVEAALRASRLDVIPLAYVPVDPDWSVIANHAAWAEVETACATLVREGKVLAWGADVVRAARDDDDDDDDDAPGIEDAAALIEARTFAVVRVAYALCDRAAAPLLRALAERPPELRVRVHVKHPLAGGALAGVLAPGVKLALRDDRRAWGERALADIAAKLGELAALVAIEPPAARATDRARAARERAERPEELECTTVAELAIRWLVRPGIDAIAPRVHRREHLAELLVWQHARPLSAALRARLAGMFPSPKTSPPT